MSKNNLTEIRKLHLKGDFEAAKAGYTKLLKKNPKQPEAAHLLGILYAEQKNYPKAILYLQLALSLTPADPVIHLHLANLYKLQGDYPKAAHLLENLLAKKSGFSHALNNLGTVYYLQNRFDDAIACYQKAILEEPNYVDAYYNLGLALNKKQDFTLSSKTFEKLLLLAPNHFAAQFHLACAQMQANDIIVAIDLFLKIEENHPNHFETQSNLATCYLKQGALNEAKAHYFKALELKNDDAQILFNLGVINMQQGNIDIAIQHYQRAKTLMPDDFAIHNNLAVAFLVKPHMNFALHHFQEALRIQPDNKAIQHTLKILSANEKLLASPPEYIKSLFDSYADHYEPHLLQALDYKIPTLLCAAVQRVTSVKNKTEVILDLGCGTGLCGVTFAAWAKMLIGVDLSPNMLIVAAQKEIYDHLVEMDITQFIEHAPFFKLTPDKVFNEPTDLVDTKITFDLVLAGDVLVYLGDIALLLGRVAALLSKGGLFAFNTEICETADFKMTQSGRFAHNKAYIEKIATLNHLKIAHYETVTTRQQNNAPAIGHLFVLQKMALH